MCRPRKLQPSAISGSAEVLVGRQCDAGETASSIRGPRCRRTLECQHPAPSSLASARSQPSAHQRLMLATLRSRAIRKAPKIQLVNLIEDGDHSVLNDLVLQRRDAQRSFPAVGFRNIHSPRWQRPIGASVNPAVKILEAIFLPGLVLLPRHTIYSWGSLPLQRVETV